MYNVFSNVLFGVTDILWISSKEESENTYKEGEDTHAQTRDA